MALLVRNFAACFYPTGIKAAKPTRESICCPLTYHDLTKLDLAAMGSNLTRPLVAAAGRWIASRMVASECQIVACDASTAMIKIVSK
jgi:hypothetical protein